MGGKAEANSKETINPIRRPGGQTGEVGMQVLDPLLLQTRAKPRGLIKSEEIGLAPPGGQFSHQRLGQTPFARGAIHFADQLLFPRKISDLWESHFRISNRLLFRCPDRVDYRGRALPPELGNFTETEG